MHYRAESEGVPRLKERDLVAVGLSMLWAPQNPRGFPIYGYQGKDIVVINSLVKTMEMTLLMILMLALLLLVGKLSSLSSEKSTESCQDLIQRSSRAGPPRGTIHEPAGDDVDPPVVNPQGETAKEVETRKKRKGDKTEEEKVDAPVSEKPCTRPSNSSFLYYVVVSDTLFGLDAGRKRSERDPDDDATLTEMMKK
ncbi:hypothetical protein HanRHA438_Chr01g0011051 [Helianthus annuus]|nr:hypothetical protein HanRHA438_Chr01g0011051 [Helianthus annuus]